MSPMDSGGSENSSSSSSSSFSSTECSDSSAGSSRVGLSSTSAGVSCAGFSSAIEESPGRSGGGSSQCQDPRRQQGGFVSPVFASVNCGRAAEPRQGAVDRLVRR